MKTKGSRRGAKAAKFVVVASRFNAHVVDKLVEGAVAALDKHGVKRKNVTVLRVPGAWELPMAARMVSAKADAVVALGAVVRGETPHFDYVAGEAARGLADVAAQTGVVVTFGVLTTDTMDQAAARAGGKAGNKGWDAAVAAVEMIALSRAIDKL